MVLAVACSALTANAQISNTAGETAETSDPLKPGPAFPLIHHIKINLLNKNYVLVELSSMKLLASVMNIDSVLNAVLQDLEPLKDSLATESNTRKVEYIIDGAGARKIRLSATSHDKTYAVTDIDIAVLKTEQDSLCITKFFPADKRTGGKTAAPQWKITMVVNNLDETAMYTKGVLNASMQQIAAEYVQRSRWTPGNDLKKSLTINHYPYDKLTPGKSDYSARLTRYSISLFGEIAVQNVQDKFVPSIAGPSVNFSFSSLYRTHTIRFNSESYFFFDRPANGKTTIYPNAFLQLAYSNKPRYTSSRPAGWGNLTASISLAYLFRRRGSESYFGKNTFKLGIGGFEYKTLSITPQLFFNGFFKNLSPSVRFSISF